MSANIKSAGLQQDMLSYYLCHQVKEMEGNYVEAITLYLKAGLPAKAARLAINKEVKYHTVFGCSA